VAPEFTWVPDEQTVATSNLTALMTARGLSDYPALHRWSVADRESFWAEVTERLGIVFATPPEAVLRGKDPRHSRWFPGARLNIAESCFGASDDEPAIVYADRGELQRLSYGQLRSDVMRVAHGLAELGISTGDRIAIAMPMTIEAVVAYLGIVWSGCVVTSIADSFAPDEIATRLEMTDTEWAITSDVVVRAGKTLPMYDKVVAAGARRAVVVGDRVLLRAGDVGWQDFLGSDEPIDPVVSDPETTTNVLFSSGTTGVPKAIPWTQLTPIKAAMDAHYHQDVHPGDVLAWPTNLGWMMGPWLIYAALINRATMALYNDAPTGGGFGRFVAEADVTMLGVVPSLVGAWRASGCMEGLDWSRVRVFSSTGEASNPDDMAYLMKLAGGVPVIEYCGGTEIGGGYITGTVVEEAIPGTFTSPALGLDLVILDDDGRRVDSGEAFLVPPSVGLSNNLLHRDHDAVYHEGVPQVGDVLLRRHGDHIERTRPGRFRALGRVDDTMNLGGIKVSSAEIERAISGLDGCREAAAIAVSPPDGGPSRLVVYAVPEPGTSPDPGVWRRQMQDAIRSQLNPLFRVAEVRVVDGLPRTASNKVMRRSLRAEFLGGS